MPQSCRISPNEHLSRISAGTQSHTQAGSPARISEARISSRISVASTARNQKRGSQPAQFIPAHSPHLPAASSVRIQPHLQRISSRNSNLRIISRHTQPLPTLPHTQPDSSQVPDLLQPQHLFLLSRISARISAWIYQPANPLLSRPSDHLSRIISQHPVRIISRILRRISARIFSPIQTGSHAGSTEHSIFLTSSLRIPSMPLSLSSTSSSRRTLSPDSSTLHLTASAGSQPHLQPQNLQADQPSALPPSLSNLKPASISRISRISYSPLIYPAISACFSSARTISAALQSPAINQLASLARISSRISAAISAEIISA
ncbi:hypothetical protein WMY93_034148 [Mugilogobius chulae]|uniref:Uncharacterized protein n=1 Tax=Mugilogobius chulae TaxID=88201 RepID=A0AAW0MQT1_9GOBI